MNITQNARREARQLFRLCLVNGMLDEERARKVVREIVAAGQRDCLAVLSHFRQLVESECARHTASVESAWTLPADLRASVQADLARAYGPGLTTFFADNPALIGGVRIRVGCDVYDGSVQARLAALEQAF